MFPKAKWKLFNIHVSIHPSIQIKFVNHCWKIQSTPMEEGGQGLPATETSAIMPILAIRSEESSDLSEDRASASARAAMAPWVSGVPDSSSTLHSSTLNSSTLHSSTLTSSRNLRSSRQSSSQSSHMSLPDTGRPGSAQATLTRVHCPHCQRFLLAKSMPKHLQTVHKRA